MPALDIVAKDVDNSSSVTDVAEGMSVIWEQAKAKLSMLFDDDALISKINSLEYDSVVNGTMILSAPTRFTKDFVKNNALDHILQFVRQRDSSILSVDIVVSRNDYDGDGAGLNDNTLPMGSVIPISDFEDGSKDWKSSEKKYIESALDERFTFENYVVGKPNQVAYAAAKRVCDVDDGKLPFNPLFLYGGVGLGKTHLMHAIAWEMKRKYPEKKVVYISAETFMYQFINSIRHKSTMAFKEELRSVDVLMVDDVQFISGKESTQEEFFHTFNDLVNNNRQVIVSADKSPSDLDGVADRLRSRLNWGMVADVHPTTFELRIGILQSKAEELNVELRHEVLEFLARKITSNVRELEGALTRLITHSMAMDKEITIDFCYETLSNLIKANEKVVSIDDIQKETAQFFNIRVADMHSAKRSKSIAVPRQIAMYLAKTLTPLSLPEIGRHFGGRDHTTVIHSVKKVENLLKSDRDISSNIDILKKMLLS